VRALQCHHDENASNTGKDVKMERYSLVDSVEATLSGSDSDLHILPTLQVPPWHHFDRHEEHHGDKPHWVKDVINHAAASTPSSLSRIVEMVHSR